MTDVLAYARLLKTHSAEHNIIFDEPIVSVSWLHENLNANNLLVLDASINKVTSASHNSHSEWQIPTSLFFDIKGLFSDIEGEFPNTFPSAEQFTQEAQKLGVNSNSAIVVYDDKGMYSSARAWWLFKAFGFNNVAVLDGGLPEWQTHNFVIEKKQNNLHSVGNFEAEYQPEFMRFFKDIQQAIPLNTKILDARSQDRFKGLVKEPRDGLRSGTIPNSRNFPFTDLLNENCFKSRDELSALFHNFVEDKEEPIIFSCGSGITACILALGAILVGYNDISVYDGSWTEYGSLVD